MTTPVRSVSQMSTETVNPEANFGVQTTPVVKERESSGCRVWGARHDDWLFRIGAWGIPNWCCGAAERIRQDVGHRRQPRYRARVEFDK